MNAYFNAMQRYVDFKGRSTRSQYWLFTLILVILSVIGLILDGAAGAAPTGEPGPIAGLIILVHLIPSLALTVRRLHDIDKSGWWVLIGVVPLIGFIVLLVFACTASTPGANRFGSLDGNGAAARSSAPPAVNGDYLDQLEKLTKLKSSGSIDDAEFQSMKADLMARFKR